jgi:golgi apyrase
MGGASAQVAFAPNGTETARHADDLMFLRLRSLDGLEKEYRVFVSTWLGYGANEARRRYVQELEKQQPKSTTLLRDPCLPKNLELPVDNNVKLVGSGSLEQCLDLQAPILAKDMDCHDDPCLFGGVHAPAIDFDVNHFIGVSEYWHTTNDIFDMGGTYDYASYSSKVETFCARDWDSILLDLKRQKWGKKLDEEKVRMVCFKAAWMMNVLHEGFGVPRIAREFPTRPTTEGNHNSTQDLIDSAKSHGYLDPFQSVDRIRGIEVSWTLGKMVLYASSTINSVNTNVESGQADIKHMVGFGPNNDKLYTDGEFYAPSGSVVPVSSGPFSRLSETFGHRIPGLVLMLAMICVAVWLVIGKDRRNRVLASTARKWFRKRRKVMGATGIYERLEAGEADDEDREVGGMAWALQELKPPKPHERATSSPRLDGLNTGVFAASMGRSESRERLPSRPESRMKD